MEDIIWTVEKGMQAGEHVGRVIGGLAALRETCREVFLICEGEDTQKIRIDRLAVSFRSITLDERPLIPFEGLARWDRRSGEPCVGFMTGDKLAMLAPAAVIDLAGIEKTVNHFVDWLGEGDHVYLTDLNGSIGNGGHTLDLVDGVLKVLGEQLVVAEMTWAESEDDGDGNTYLHIVMNDGRYRQIAIGDLGR